jgi:asparagine synthase (glutamine-hydrolysing)
MCGIFAFLSALKEFDPLLAINALMRIKNRGPDNTTINLFNLDLSQLIIGFHRLSIMDVSHSGNQPFMRTYSNKTIYVMCNGEIYNYKKLIEEFNLTSEIDSSSDCAVILPMYCKLGFVETVKRLHGEFAIIIIEIEGSSVTMMGARDRFGVRPLYYKEDENNVCMSSELKGIVNLFQPQIYQFPPGNCVVKKLGEPVIFTRYYDDIYPIVKSDLTTVQELIRDSLIQCVKERLVSDRPVAFLLSGGLDSSLVAGIANMLVHDTGKKLKTFTTGMIGSTDIFYAQQVAKYIDSNHTEVFFTPEEGLAVIPEVIKAIESYDITTVRASVGQFLVSQYIKNKTDYKVVYSADGSDEICHGYMMFHNAPNPEESQKESERLLREIHLYDVSRVDRSISYHGLEARLPFLDHKFADIYMSIDPSLKVPRDPGDFGGKKLNRKMEKALLRSSFHDLALINEDVLYRPKEAFSDGVSGQKKSWFQIIQQHVEQIISDEEFQTASRYTHNTPPTKEAYWYRKIYESLYGNNDTIPHFWLPSWSGNIQEPSARVLSIYQENVGLKK